MTPRLNFKRIDAFRIGYLFVIAITLIVFLKPLVHRLLEAINLNCHINWIY